MIPTRTAKAFGLAGIFVCLVILHRVLHTDFSHALIDTFGNSNSNKQKPAIITIVSTVSERPSPTSTTSGIPSSSLKPIQSQPFPKKIWHKGSRPVSQETRERMETWFEKNPEFRHEFLSDESGDAYVKDKFADRPDILNLFLNLTVPILKADLLRYLILLADGGIWSDLDVTCLGKVDDWIPAKWKDQVNIVVGLEFDFPFTGEGERLASQFTSWVVMAKPGLPHLKMVVDDVVEELTDIAKAKNKEYSELKKSDLSDVVDVTGPKKLTISLMKSLSIQLGGLVDDRNVSMFKRPVLCGDLLVLPQAAFAAAQGGYPKDQGPSFVTHHYAGSWKADND